MKLYPLVQVGHPTFRLGCEPYTEKEILSREVQMQVARMKYTTREIHGVGLAAPQVGIQKKMFVIRIGPSKYRPKLSKVLPYAVFNPEILEFNKYVDADWEGCFSVAEAGLFAKVDRPTSIKVRYLDAAAITIERQLEGLEARIFQHEYDHLHGTVFLDHQPDSATFMSYKEYRAMREREAEK